MRLIEIIIMLILMSSFVSAAGMSPDCLLDAPEKYGECNTKYVGAGEIIEYGIRLSNPSTNIVKMIFSYEFDGKIEVMDLEIPGAIDGRPGLKSVSLKLKIPDNAPLGKEFKLTFSELKYGSKGDIKKQMGIGSLEGISSGSISKYFIIRGKVDKDYTLLLIVAGVVAVIVMILLMSEKKKEEIE